MANELMSRFAAILAISVALSGCASTVGIQAFPQSIFGYVYSHTTEPLMTDFSSTPAAAERSSGAVKTLTFYVTIQWDKNGIGAIAKANGIEEIYYADVETIKVLNYWQRRRVHIYGR